MEAGLTRARATDHQHVLIDIVLGNLVPAHHDALSLRQKYVLVKFWIYERAYIGRRSPTRTTVLDPVAVFLGIFGLDVDRRPDTGRADQPHKKVLGVEAGEGVAGYDLTQAGDRPHALCHHIRASGQPVALAHAVEKPEHERIGEVENQKLF